MRMNSKTPSIRRRGRVPGAKTDRYQVLLSPDLAEWGKQQPGGLSGLLRRLLEEAHGKPKPPRSSEQGDDGGRTQSLPLTVTSQRRFRCLVQKWKRAQVFTSSTSQMVLDPAYQEIIGIGGPAVPLLLRELETDPDH